MVFAHNGICTWFIRTIPIRKTNTRQGKNLRKKIGKYNTMAHKFMLVYYLNKLMVNLLECASLILSIQKVAHDSHVILLNVFATFEISADNLFFLKDYV